MAITALPPSTIHLLGSAQALTTPTSLVKELIDNALDAKATYIDIIISSNTIDKIEVRDNGHGIAEEDLDALGRRGHTSKLRSFDELQSIGGVSLGFRGEALASAVHLGQVSVTTRTDGQPVASTVHIKPPGGVASKSRASHPVGTTVSVSKFLYNLPVRKQTAEKEAAKTLKTLKELLHSYALARPKIRYSLKVSKGGKGSWSYIPRPNDGMKEVAAQIIGREAAAQCIEKSSSFSERDRQSNVSKGSGACDQTQDALLSDVSSQFIAEVFMPKPDATSVGHGQYISVDSRPVAHNKGTMKKIVSSFKYYVKNSPMGGVEKPKDPFLWLNIKCPVSSYDPNVEPAKDDIVFSNEYLVLESIEIIFKDVYGKSVATPTAADPIDVNEELDDFELLMSRKKVAPEPASAIGEETDVTGLLDATNLVAAVESSVGTASCELREAGDVILLDGDEIETPGARVARKWDVDMSENYSEEVQESRRTGLQFQDSTYSHYLNSAVPDSDKSLNPWIIAKLNAPVPPQNGTNLPTAIVVPHKPRDFSQNILPTPQQSSDPIDVESILLRSMSPVRPRQTHSDHLRTPEPTLIFPPSHQSRRRAYSRPDVSDLEKGPLIAQRDDGLSFGDGSNVIRRRNDFNSARSLLHGSIPTSPVSRACERTRGVNKPFVPPMQTGERHSPLNGLRQTTLMTPFQTPSTQHVGNQRESIQSSKTDLAWTMDYEHRKEDANRKRRQEAQAARAEVKNDANKRYRADEEDDLETLALGVSARRSPHKNRYDAAIANLATSQQEPSIDSVVQQSFKTTLPDGDPRAYLMKRQKSMQASARGLGETPKPMRAKSTRLPLEKIPEDGQVHMLMLKYSVDVGYIQNAMLEVTGSDTYVNQGTRSVGIMMNAAEAKLAERMIQTAVEKWRSTDAGKHYEVEYKYDNLINVK